MERTAIGILFTFLFVTLLLTPVTALDDSDLSPPQFGSMAHPDQPFPLSQLLVIIQTSTLPNADTDNRFYVNLMRDGRMIYYSVADKEVSSVVETLYELFCKPVRKT